MDEGRRQPGVGSSEYSELRPISYFPRPTSDILRPSSCVPHPSSLDGLIKSLAQGLGFDEVGITTLASLRGGEEAIEAWVREGRHGTMRYLEDYRARRERLLREIPDAKSVICLGVNYFQGEQRAKGGVLTGRVARYAWGRDYHQVIRKRHETLIRRLREMLGPASRWKSCVDTQPVPERSAAMKAGLGFFGKHTGLLSRRFGPWLFLSEIVTDLELEPDVPREGDCGTCSHCQRVCPTGALDQDYRIDARRCIAYLTIEHKGVIPRELRPQLKDWIFGCDECLAVCPFRSKEKETAWTEFRNTEGVGEWLTIDELFEIPSGRAYERRFAGSAVGRASLKQMLRNACVVLGNSKCEDAIPYLERALKHPSALVRIHAAWGLAQIPSSKARAVLVSHLNQEEDPEVRGEIQIGMARVESL